jgi:hypothetical protein
MILRLIPTKLHFILQTYVEKMSASAGIVNN